ncbi:Hsp20/alpha crystallin family protein [Sediminispirochaeta bajacaliforniensis]|uniref:Hsp20/alpha crystallin family protein n=1 Tax=Sediminispirochaeta bajacaliforniensis TaxID=148 RepID=UPI000379993A|nr:Hsp20/alpha crystallin family protein [Sediminispirochaeta bajacaliforniensis]
MDDAKRYRNPVTDICEDEGKVVLRIEMPGVGKEDIDVQIDGDELIIYGKRSDVSPEGDSLVRERITVDYRKIFTLDETIDRDKVDAFMENGVLRLELALKEAVKPRKIQIS